MRMSPKLSSPRPCSSPSSPPACGAAAPAATRRIAGAAAAPPSTPVATAPALARTRAFALARPTAGGPAATTKAKVASKTPSIIFSGDMKMMADETRSKTIDRIIDPPRAGGHVASRKDSSVQVKVPSAQFRETMKAIDALGGVTSQSISAEDVSEEMHDLEVRSPTSAPRARLSELMNKAGAIPDVLTVEKELGAWRRSTKIEGRLSSSSHAALPPSSTSR